ncbi:LysR family transcriptional regulator [Rubeoparvulum massiliense]|uniref:LysR family transcriptional regulator n=1 Tax=Rubeoparvulum massiliense TaxID=1631346 RepID=UPI00065E134E|nr:LysR family transcriptional regulator [Rubeoparvulum massiliense]
MDMEDLKAFKMVAQYGSISKAATILNFAQSSVTLKIQRLEAHFQTPLFYRQRHGMLLTPAGNTLLQYVDQILHALMEAEQQLIYATTPKGPLSIGSMETTAAIRLPIPLYHFHEQYPEVDFALKTGPTDELVQMVLNYEIDGAFVAGPIAHDELRQEAIFAEELALVGKRTLFPDEKDPSFYRWNILVFKQGCSYRKRLEDWLDHEKMIPHKVMEFGSLEAMMGCLNAGLGFSLLPKSVLEPMNLDDLHYTSIPEEYRHVTTYFIKRKETKITAALEKFLEVVKTSRG